MLEAIFFILGAIFSIALLMTILTLLDGLPRLAPLSGPQAAATASRTGPRTTARPSGSARRQNPAAEARLSIGVASLAEREAYRIQANLERVQATLSRIADSNETAAAKIAAQTLRRISQADARPTDRLDFAKSRLELLSLRPEPRARHAAKMALAMLG